MTALLLASGTFPFADGNAGHVCNLGSSPAINDLDVLCVNSDTVVSTSSGFTLAVSAVANQGSYIFYRKAVGGEGSTVTVTTSGNFNCLVSWSRWSGTLALDQVASALGTSSTVTPPVTTPALAGSGELSIAYAALHGFVSAPNSPAWSTGYTPLTIGNQSTGGAAVSGIVGYNAAAGPSAESPSVSWVNTADDRYILVAVFTPGTAAARIPDFMPFFL